MSASDILPIRSAGRSSCPTYRFERDDRDTSSDTALLAGEPCKAQGTSSQFALKLVDADLTIATDQTFIGVAASAGTETASVDGRAEFYMPLEGVVYKVRALTASTADAESEILAIQGEYHVIDLTASAYRMDVAAGDAAANAFLIVGGDPNKSEVHFMIRSDATVFGRARV